MYADVIVPRHLHRAFTYTVPPGLRDRIQIGSIVLVPFGASRLYGMVVTLGSDPPAAWQAPLREIVSLSQNGLSDGALDPALLKLTRLVADYYLAPWGQCIRLVEPVKARRSVRLVLTDAGRDQGSRKLPPAAGAILERLAAAPHGLTVGALRQTLKRSAPEATDLRRRLATLKRRGWIREQDGTIRSKVLAARPQSHLTEKVPAGAVPLWPDLIASAELDPVEKALAARRHAAFLLELSPTRRLEALPALVQAALASERRALIIAPEIPRASALAERLSALWPDRVALVHSGLPPAARAGAWDRIRRGAADVIVGTRLAVFAPAGRIGLIVIDGEDDPALKEQEEPRYHARDVAWMRAREHDAVLVLGSAHPSLETRTSAVVERLPVSLSSLARPEVRIVNLRELPAGTLLSPALLQEMAVALKARTPIILFQNRKGFASALVCQDCGAALHCTHCRVALTFYKAARRMACRYCGHAAAVPELCPTCQGAALAPVGGGTERIEGLLREMFPSTRIGRLDRESARTGRQADTLRREAAAGQFDILVGTQMLFQGVSLPPAGLVGVLCADAGLHLPDFRSAERCYQVLAEAVALAKPAAEGGRVLLQTHFPRHHAIAAISSGEPAVFYEQESKLREALGYPPFTSLISLSVSGRDPGRVKAAAQDWSSLLRRGHPHEQHGRQGSLSDARLLPDVPADAVLGPIPSAVPKGRGRYRWQMLVKGRDAQAVRQAVKTSLEELESRRSKGLKFEVDVDPVEMF